MAVDDLATNLRLLCSYGRSISDVCRRLKMNRQQFNRYLAGKAKPSLRTVRRICDFFGIDDHEIFLNYEDFRNLIRLRPPKLDSVQNPLHEFFERLCQPPDQPFTDSEKYVGYYYYYFQPDRNIRDIYRNLLYIRKEGDLLLSKQIERYPNSEFNLPNVIKHEGIVYSMANRLVITERETHAEKSHWHTILNMSDYSRLTFLSGLSIGIAPDSGHDISCFRSLCEYLGGEINIRAALSTCGAHKYDSPAISDYVRHCVTNELADNDYSFMPRF